MGAVDQMSVIEPATQKWLDDLAVASADGPSLYELSPQEARNVLRGVQTSVRMLQPPADVVDREIAGGPTGQISVRIYKPNDTATGLPVIVHSHGGGWILGDKDTHERLDRELTNAVNAAIVFVDYTPAPEAKYPTQNEQAYAVLEWAAANAADFGGDAERLALVGDSVGGNMTAALTLMARERRGPKVAAQVLFYPVTNADLDTDSYHRYADGPWLTRPAMQWFWNAYLPDETQRSQVTASPLQASTDQLRGLPPTLVINGEHDVLRDEGEAFARKLSQAGVRVTQVRYAGTIHDFVLLNPITYTPAPRAAIAQAAHFLRESFKP